MAFWLVSAEAFGTGKERLVPPLPEGIAEVWPDLTGCHVRGALKQRLQAAFPERPPEAYARMTERLAPYVLEMRAGDYLAIMAQDKTQLAFATITGGFQWIETADGSRVQGLPLHWEEARLSARRLRAHLPLLKKAERWARPIENVSLRTAFRDRLKLPGARFAGVKWLVGLVILVRMIEFALNLWKRQGL